ncbi:heme lyase NrfEFG subunit NrfF [Providencia stuartii]|uniref:heme lyase NrfEFG subunit NrfF n=1 Tax=Providencia stuartii TaxID=588 RepID=UPI000537D3BF|nr:heme lyase NrfEFG subunit NrfF [Providencia stuartii]AXO18186.1 heme lyase NrfEFG subunit NrfF [Providencia stuartii]
MNKLLHYVVLTLLLMATNIAKADIVDTWQFATAEQQTTSLQIAAQLRCPQCQNQNLLESNAPTAVSMRHQVYKMVAEGKTEAEIRSYMTERYGDFVLYNPPLHMGTIVLWSLPFIGFIFVIALLYYLIKKRASVPRTNQHNSTEATITPTSKLSIQLTHEIPSQHAEVKRNDTLSYYAIHLCVALLLLLTIAGYFFLPRFSATYHEYQRISDPLHILTPLQQQQSDLIRLQNNIRQFPQNGDLWAILGEYYLYQNSYDNALIAYNQALKYTGENAQLYSAIATVLYYQAGQQMTEDTMQVIEHALSIDKHEVTALMLLASDAFMHANYEKAISLWQQLLDSNSPRINRSQLIEAINMATIMKNNH